jgi:two-component system, OmpR family, KDP operon response regulator KdpE
VPLGHAAASRRRAIHVIRRTGSRKPGRLITQAQLRERVWGLKDTKNNYVRVYLAAIRRKLEPDPVHPRYFLTEPRLGIRFDRGTPPVPAR